MAKLTLADAEAIAGRNRPWTFRMECTGTTTNGNPSHKFWYATGRGLNEAVETGYGAVGNAPQFTLTDWTDLRTKVAEKLAKGYQYAPTNYIRMSAANWANVSGQPAPAAPPAPVHPTTVAAPAPATPPPAPQAAPGSIVYAQQASAALLALGEPYSLIRAMKTARTGNQITGYTAYDEAGDELMQMSLQQGLKFARDYDVEIVFG